MTIESWRTSSAVTFTGSTLGLARHGSAGCTQALASTFSPKALCPARRLSEKDPAKSSVSGACCSGDLGYSRTPSTRPWDPAMAAALYLVIHKRGPSHSTLPSALGAAQGLQPSVDPSFVLAGLSQSPQSQRTRELLISAAARFCNVSCTDWQKSCFPERRCPWASQAASPQRCFWGLGVVFQRRRTKRVPRSLPLMEQAGLFPPLHG